MNITMAHGSGGESTSRLISDIFSRYFNNEYLSALEDSAVVPGSNRLAMTTDSFVVTPIIFPGGDIGRLSVCGTVNVLLMSGSIPKYITCGCILEEGLDIDELERIVSSMSETAREAGVIVVTGDTKVVERHSEHPGLIINTSGVGFIPEGLEVPGPAGLKDKDVIILSGNLGDHHAAILGARMGIESGIVSDNAPLCEMVRKLMDGGVRVHAMRDVTRGGLGTVLNEFASASFCSIELEEKLLPVSAAVKDFCGILGLDPLYMGNEGKMVISVDAQDADKALLLIREARYGENAAIIGSVSKGGESDKGTVTIRTRIGGRRVVGLMYGEGLPRIC